jgi:quercetin dioxygenase-like cupin family protein
MSEQLSIPPARALPISQLVKPVESGIASRVLAKTGGGNVTLFSFDAGQGLSEHTAPFDALVVVLAGTLRLRIAQETVDAVAGTIVRMPAHVPHALDAVAPARMLLEATYGRNWTWRALLIAMPPVTPGSKKPA